MIDIFPVVNDYRFWINCNHYGWKYNEDEIRLAPSDDELKILNLNHIGFTGIISDSISISYSSLGCSIEFDIYHSYRRNNICSCNKIIVLGKLASELSKWIRPGILIHVEADEDGFVSSMGFKRFIATSVTRLEL